MPEYKVTMVREKIQRVETFINVSTEDLDQVKAAAWKRFDDICLEDLEQNNYTKIKRLT